MPPLLNLCKNPFALPSNSGQFNISVTADFPQIIISGLSKTSLIPTTDPYFSANRHQVSA